MLVTPAARYILSFKFYVQSSMPPNPSFDKLREADPPAKGFPSVLCVWVTSSWDSFDYCCCRSNRGVHLSSAWDTNTGHNSCMVIVFPWDLCVSFMLLQNTGGYISICLSQGDWKEYLVLNMLKRLFPFPILSFWSKQSTVNFLFFKTDML